jgi:hypothetical protein
MPQSPFAALFPLLPRHDEQSSLCTSVKTEQLREALLKKSGVSAEAAELLLNMLERLFNSLALLDPLLLKQSRWRFVSFPAQVCGNALLHVLADSDQDLLEADFWDKDNAARQQELVNALETRRVRNHRGQAAQPARYIHNAWALIRIGGEFLLRRIGDENLYSPHEERTSAADLTSLQHLSNEEILQFLQGQQSPLVFRAARTTLARGLAEKFGLSADECEILPWRKLKPYQEISKLACAYTHYDFNVFSLQLTLSGMFKLLREESRQPETFARFSVDELLAGENRQGRKAYMEPFQAEFGFDQAALRKELLKVRESYLPSYHFSEPADSFTLSLRGQLRQGEAEKPLEIPLEEQQLRLLWALGAHAKGWAFNAWNEAVAARPYGWLEILQPELLTELQVLAGVLDSHALPLLEIEQERYVRLSAAPELIFFSADNCTYLIRALKADKYALLLRMAETQTPLGTVGEILRRLEIPAALALALQKLGAGAADSQAISATMRDNLEAKLRLPEIGLRHFLVAGNDGLFRPSCAMAAK